MPKEGVKLLGRNLRACLQEVTSSLCLFKLPGSALQMIKYFSHRHKLQRFEAGLKGVTSFKIFQVKLNPIFEKRLLNMIEKIKFRTKWTQSYNDLLQKNITKTYRKVTPNTMDSIELKAKNTVKKLQLDSRINTTAKGEAYITLKDHKPNFANPTCHLINPAKSEIGKTSKQLLDRINTALVSKLK